MKEVSHEIAVEVWNNYIAIPQNYPDKHKFSFKDLEKMINKKLEPMRKTEETPEHYEMGRGCAVASAIVIIAILIVLITWSFVW
jgi:hypothetical protein